MEDSQNFLIPQNAERVQGRYVDNFTDYLSEKDIESYCDALTAANELYFNNSSVERDYIGGDNYYECN